MLAEAHLKLSSVPKLFGAQLQFLMFLLSALWSSGIHQNPRPRHSGELQSEAEVQFSFVPYQKHAPLHCTSAAGQHRALWAALLLCSVLAAASLAGTGSILCLLTFPVVSFC